MSSKDEHIASLESDIGELLTLRDVLVSKVEALDAQLTLAYSITGVEASVAAMMLMAELKEEQDE